MAGIRQGAGLLLCVPWEKYQEMKQSKTFNCKTISHATGIVELYGLVWYHLLCCLFYLALADNIEGLITAETCKCPSLSDITGVPTHK